MSIVDMLIASRNEQRTVTIYFRSGKIGGVVTQLESEAVEVRHERSRSIIDLKQIDAVTTE